jgi:hypothetical protein
MYRTRYSCGILLKLEFFQQIFGKKLKYRSPVFGVFSPNTNYHFIFEVT